MFRSHPRGALVARLTLIALAMTLPANSASAAIMLMTRTAKIREVVKASPGVRDSLVETEFKIKLKYDTSKGATRHYDVYNPLSPQQGWTDFLERAPGSNPFISGSYEFGGREYDMDLESAFNTSLTPRIDIEQRTTSPRYYYPGSGPLLDGREAPDDLWGNFQGMGGQGIADGPDSEIVMFDFYMFGYGWGKLPDFESPMESVGGNWNGQFKFQHFGIYGEEFGTLRFGVTDDLAALYPSSLKIERLDGPPSGPPVGIYGPPGGIYAPPPGSVVPEPSTWALMIFGFGLSGALLRRRRIATAA